MDTSIAVQDFSMGGLYIRETIIDNPHRGYSSR
jgi:hypothetical protein